MSKQSKKSAGHKRSTNPSHRAETRRAPQPPEYVAGHPRRISRGLHPGPRFTTQANTLAGLYRSRRLGVEVDGDQITPDELEGIAIEQTKDEHEDARLQAAYATYHAGYLERSQSRALRFAAALKAAKALLANDPAALRELDRASFTTGKRGRQPAATQGQQDPQAGNGAAK